MQVTEATLPLLQSGPWSRLPLLIESLLPITFTPITAILIVRRNHLNMAPSSFLTVSTQKLSHAVAALKLANHLFISDHFLSSFKIKLYSWSPSRLPLVYPGGFLPRTPCFGLHGCLVNSRSILRAELSAPSITALNFFALSETSAT